MGSKLLNFAPNNGVIMKKKIKILISNDDGIDAPGLNELRDALEKVGEVTVVAPSSEKSAASHCISINKHMKCKEKFVNGKLIGWTFDGTPVDCVKFAVTFLMKDNLPDIVVSGINRGQNTSNNIIYSGTVAAALEGAVLGIPAIAVSLNSRSEDRSDYKFAAKFIGEIIPHVVKKGLPNGTILNINIPSLPENEIKGIEITKQGQGCFIDLFIKADEGSRKSNEDEIIVKNIGMEMKFSEEPDENDDRVLFHKNKISITPLHYDFTCHSLRKDLKKWINDINFLAGKKDGE